MSIEVTEAKEGVNISEFLWSRPFGDPFKLGRIHGYYTMLYYILRKLISSLSNEHLAGLRKRCFSFMVSRIMRVR